jgi:hypothetical protein
MLEMLPKNQTATQNTSQTLKFPLSKHHRKGHHFDPNFGVSKTDLPLITISGFCATCSSLPFLAISIIAAANSSTLTKPIAQQLNQGKRLFCFLRTIEGLTIKVDHNPLWMSVFSAKAIISDSAVP